MVQPATSETLPRVIDRYELSSVLGSGAFATVYRGQHTLTRQPVAVKVMRSAGSLGPRWLAEARAAASIQHRNVVRVLDCGQAGDEVFLVMDLAEGPTLASVLQQYGPMPAPRAVDIALQVLDGLAAAHARHIVHRDIKPPNIVLSRDPDGSEVARILDFGVSKELSRFDHTTTLEGTSIGTPGYMAPELFGDAKSADPRADVYAVAAMLYEIFSNRLPFVGRSYEDFVVQVATKRPVPLLEVAPQTPGPLAAVIDRGLARDREARWPTVESFAAAIRGAMLGIAAPSSHAFAPTLDVRTTGHPPPVSTLRTAPPPVVRSSIRPGSERRSRALPIALGIIVIVSFAAAISVFVLFRTLMRRSTASSPVAPSASAAPSAPAETASAPTAVAAAPTQRVEQLAHEQEARSAPLPPQSSGGIRFKFPPQVVGQAKATAVDALSRRIIPLAQRCRPPHGSAPVTARVRLFVQAEGTISIAQVPTDPGDVAAAECLAPFFKENANPSTFAPGGGGIVMVEATLDPL